MYIVVIGLGSVGEHVLNRLAIEDHDIVVIDHDPDKLNQTDERFNVGTLLGYGANQAVLEEAGVQRADLVAAVTDDDEVNLLAALVGKQLGAKRVVARVQGANWAAETDSVQTDFLGVDVVINPVAFVAQELLDITLSHGASDVFSLADGQLEMALVEVDARSPYLDKTFAELTMPTDVLAAAIVRGEQVLVPRGDNKVAAGDRVYFVGEPAGVVEAEDMFSTRREARRVCIVGGSEIARRLMGQLLRRGMSVALIEKNRERAEELAAEFGEARVIEGSGTDVSLLRDEEISRYDLLLSLTSKDEVNLMVTLLAKDLGVQTTGCTVHEGAHVNIYQHLGIDIVLSPRLVASDQILRFCRSSATQALTQLADGRAEVINIRVRRDCPVVDKPLAEVDFPPGSLVVGLLRDEIAAVPTGAAVIQRGDEIMILVLRDARAEIDKLFGIQ